MIILFDFLINIKTIGLKTTTLRFYKRKVETLFFSVHQCNTNSKNLARFQSIEAHVK